MDVRDPLLTDTDAFPVDLRLVAALAEEQRQDFVALGADPRPELNLFHQLHSFTLVIDQVDSTKLASRTTSMPLAFGLRGRGATRTIEVAIDFGGYLRLLKGLPDWPTSFRIDYLLMGIKVVAAKTGSLENRDYVRSEFHRLATSYDATVKFAALLSVVPPVLLQRMGGATPDAISALAMQFHMPVSVFAGLVALYANHSRELSSPLISDGWHEARYFRKQEGHDSRNVHASNLSSLMPGCAT